MANFDTTTYPLSDRTQFSDELNVARDIMDDGTMGIRVLGDDTFRTLRCEFEPMSEQVSNDFAAYLVTNRATELDMVLAFGSPQERYRGYIFAPPQMNVIGGRWHVWRLTFRGRKV